MDNVVRLPPQARQLELFPEIDPGQWQGRLPPRREWLVQDFYARRTVGILAGDGKIGKSAIAQMLCTCAVMGLPWLGLRVQQCRAVYFACEDDEQELERRQYAINRHLGVEHADVGDAGLIICPREGMDNILSALNPRTWRMDPTELMVTLTRRAVECGVQLVVIDTHAQTFAGRVNHGLDAIGYTSQLKRLAKAIDGLVVLITHPSESGRSSGSGEVGSRQWRNAVRSFVYMHKHKTDGLVLEQLGANYSRGDHRIPLEWHDGVFRVREQQPTRYAAD